jgi:hypothetical protein
MVRRLIKFTGVIFSHYWNRKELTDKCIVEMRFNSCQGCEHFRSSIVRKSCNLCKCTLSDKVYVLNKLSHDSESCPINRWSAMTPMKENDNA